MKPCETVKVPDGVWDDVVVSVVCDVVCVVQFFFLK